ncbi:MAG TPA: primosomal protein N' [bacterium]|mgnify:FL=1|nr:primosomal protein N' [bacterium]
MVARQRYVTVSPLLVPVDKSFDYAVPERLTDAVTAGSMVVVPFGKRRIFGVVARITDIKPERQLKFVESVVDDFRSMPSDLLSLCLWMSRMCLCPLNAVLETAFPFHRKMSGKGIDRTAFQALQRRTALEKNVTVMKGAFTMADADDFAGLERAPAQRRVMKTLLREGGSLPARTLVRIADATMQTVKELEKKGLVFVGWMPKDMSPSGEDETAPSENDHTLNPDQREAFGSVCSAIIPQKHQVFLLQGVTGSGKTEIYMQAARCCIGNGKKALILVPEIALATQIIARFMKRFAGRVAIWHSSLSMSERLFEWNRIVSGEVDIVIGARSAVFAPLENIGLIVVDEEHESSYKQEHRPMYHARDAAVQRAKLVGCPVVLGGATPSLETIHMVRSGKIKRLTLPSRVGASEMPDIAIIDMRRVQPSRVTSLFSPALINSVAETFEKNEQSMIFLNHRGYAQYIQCFSCGETIKCPLCSVNMKYHRMEALLKCHICGHSETKPERCPNCGAGGSALRYYGFGTERVMNQLKRKFKDARIERMDRDTVTRRGEYRRIINDFEEREIDILVGTQMIAKGLDFPGVTLVGVISADSIINMPDFRAGERTFQLLTQVAGRAGRRDIPGRVIIQTLNPDHPAIRAAAGGDPDDFYDFELKIRREALYPPFTQMANFIISSEDERESSAVANETLAALEKAAKNAKKNEYIGLLGPAEAPFFKMHNRFRYLVLLRGASIKVVLAVAREAMEALPATSRKCVSVDVNPQNMM